jgi:hypothetical protein
MDSQTQDSPSVIPTTPYFDYIESGDYSDSEYSVVELPRGPWPRPLENEYVVENILLEFEHYPPHDTQGRPPSRAVQYLIKWEGYPLVDCTWEYPDTIYDCIGYLPTEKFEDWVQEKERIKQGISKPFNTHRWQELCRQETALEQLHGRLRHYRKQALIILENVKRPDHLGVEGFKSKLTT